MDTQAAPLPDDACSIDALAAALAERCEQTALHCDRVEALAVALGQACGLPAADLDHLRIAARYHDIGKIGIPDHVLHKPGALDAGEMALMRSHPARGERIFLATRRDDAAQVARIIRHHHECHDGSGYPDGLGAGRIPVPAQILMLADHYDAMASHRPYNGARPHRAIMRIMDGEQGTKTDPALFRTFADLIERSPLRID